MSQNNQHISPPAAARKIETLTMMECHQLLNVFLIRNGTPKQFRRGVRNYAMVLLMLDAGLRVGELCKLLQSDLLFNGQAVQTLLVRADIAKYNIERAVPLSSRVQLAIAEMLKQIWKPPQGGPGDYAFYQKRPCYHLTPRQVQRIIKAAARQSIGRAIHPHVLRHTFATKLAKVIDIRGVQLLLGHKQMSSTQVYLHPAAEDLKNAVDRITEDDTMEPKQP